MSEMKLEVVLLPVSDVDRAKRFYSGLGWRLDADLVTPDGSRVVQFTPPGSGCSIHLRQRSPAGVVQGLMLIVSDIDAARAELAGKGADVSEVFHWDAATKKPAPGADPENRSYRTYATFKDPDGNGWLLQEIRTRLPGRM
jgi:catechol 2,3-dioxygenase-like lactoylglutathione lyase family enzyme